MLFQFWRLAAVYRSLQTESNRCNSHGSKFFYSFTKQFISKWIWSRLIVVSDVQNTVKLEWQEWCMHCVHSIHFLYFLKNCTQSNALLRRERSQLRLCLARSTSKYLGDCVSFGIDLVFRWKLTGVRPFTTANLIVHNCLKFFCLLAYHFFLRKQLKT